MRHRITRVELKRKGDKMIVRAMGQSSRGTRFIVGELEVEAVKTSDAAFKTEVAAAVSELVAVEPLPL